MAELSNRAIKLVTGALGLDRPMQGIPNAADLQRSMQLFSRAAVAEAAGDKAAAAALIQQAECACANAYATRPFVPEQITGTFAIAIGADVMASILIGGASLFPTAAAQEFLVANGVFTTEVKDQVLKGLDVDIEVMAAQNVVGGTPNREIGDAIKFMLESALYVVPTRSQQATDVIMKPTRVADLGIGYTLTPAQQARALFSSDSANITIAFAGAPNTLGLTTGLVLPAWVTPSTLIVTVQITVKGVFRGKVPGETFTV